MPGFVLINAERTVVFMWLWVCVFLSETSILTWNSPVLDLISNHICTRLLSDFPGTVVFVLFLYSNIFENL